MSSPLAAWAFRAQPRRRYKSGHVPEQKAKELLARIEREGISTLEDGPHVETWDELALRRLTESSRMGLVELRCIAVDAQRLCHDLSIRQLLGVWKCDLITWLADVHRCSYGKLDTTGRKHEKA
eukprot:Skav221710  [mRNA]  locus=scaffold542:66225:68598:- [translate_table: standard]